jgi:HNH endonuclease
LLRLKNYRLRNGQNATPTYRDGATSSGYMAGMEIALPQGFKTVIDDPDWDLVKNFSWHLHCNGAGKKYVGAGKQLLHRLIMGVTNSKIQIDHINGDGLDNRRCNLRLCNNSQNHQNRRKRRGSVSKYKGVTFRLRGKRPDRKRWEANICLAGRTRFLGSFSTEREAAIAYNNAAIVAFGKFSLLNEID